MRWHAPSSRTRRAMWGDGAGLVDRAYSVLYARRGALMVLGSAVAFATGALFGQLSHVAGVWPAWFVLGRCVLQTLWTLALMWWYDIEPFEDLGDKLGLVLVRALFGSFSSNIVLYTQLMGLQLGYATVFFFSVPLYTLVAGHYVIGEKAGALEIACVLMGMAGVVLIAQPSFLFPRTEPEPGWDYAVMCLLAGSTAAFGYIARRRVKSVNSLPIVLIGGLMGIAMMIPPCLYVRLPIDAPPKTILYLLCAGTMLFVDICLTNVGLQYEPASHASVIRLAAPVIGYGFQTLIMRKPPDPAGVAGTLIVAAVVVLMIARSTTSEDLHVPFLAGTDDERRALVGQSPVTEMTPVGVVQERL